MFGLFKRQKSKFEISAEDRVKLLDEAIERVSKNYKERINFLTNELGSTRFELDTNIVLTEKMRTEFINQLFEKNKEIDRLRLKLKPYEQEVTKCNPLKDKND
ncbi:MAG: hypothetical protein RLZZ469_1651 [Bacteroidota bacterium]|jgi:cell shape-determining protein MreC